MDEAPHTPLYRTWKFRIYAGIVALLLIIALQNMERVDVDVLFWTLASVPKLVLILVCIAIGALGQVAGASLFRALRGPR